MINFYNAADNLLYAKPNSQFITQDRFRGNVAPVSPGLIEEEKFTETFGIPATKVYQNSSDGGSYIGSPSNLVTDFQSIVDARQNRLNNPSDTFLGFNTMKDQQLTGADMGEYIGSNTAVPKEQTMMGKAQSFLTPQSSENILTSGYNKPYGSAMGPGIVGTLLGRLDNYHNLSRPDQAFIAQNMGYTGPTVFGANNSGASKDPFGLNVRSMFGNYAERVGVESENLGKMLGGGLAEKYGVEWDEETGTYKGANAYEANKMTRLLRARYNYYTNKNLEYADLVNKKAELQGIEDTQVAKNFVVENPNYGNAEKNINPGSGGGSGYDPDADYSGSDKRSEDNRSSDLGFSDIRLKENVELIGKSPSNINIYKFNYKDSPTTYQGAMAHEVPWASQKHNSGYLMVDYNKIDVNFKKI